MVSVCNDHKILESSEEHYVVHKNIEKLEIIYEIVQKKSENMMSDKMCTIFFGTKSILYGMARDLHINILYRRKQKITNHLKT